MDWLDYFRWWLEKFDECEQHLKVITREQWIDLLDAYDAADEAWQAAFDGVLAGVDEELIAIVNRLNRHAEESSMFLYAHGWRWDEDGNRITQSP